MRLYFDRKEFAIWHLLMKLKKEPEPRRRE